jgi:DNA-binding transcriptional ArsR family regulator
MIMDYPSWEHAFSARTPPPDAMRKSIFATVSSAENWKELGRMIAQTPTSIVAQIAPNAVFKALSDQTRRVIFERLSREGEQTVRRLTTQSGVSQPAISKHLSVLKAAGLVRDRRMGRETHYSAQPENLLPLFDWLGVYGAFWRGRFDELENLLNRMDQ